MKDESALVELFTTDAGAFWGAMVIGEGTSKRRFGRVEKRGVAGEGIDGSEL